MRDTMLALLMLGVAAASQAFTKERSCMPSFDMPASMGEDDGDKAVFLKAFVPRVK